MLNRHQRLVARSVGPALLAALALGLTGCNPKVSITIGPPPEGGPLVQHTVLEEPGAAEGVVAMIDVRGIIADVRAPGFLGSTPSPTDQLVARLDAAAKDEGVKAVVLRINSPGGTVTGSDIMFREVRRFAERTKKPVIASLGEVAASGGYYLACSADAIVAQPTTITGSIGVIIPTINFSEGLSRIGITSRDVMSGPNKNMASPFEPIREGNYAVLQGIVDEFYGRFTALVVERRPGFSVSEHPEAVDGRILTGARAVEIGLADREGGVREAFELAKTKAGLKSARLIKFTSPEDRPRTPYAAAGDLVPSAGSAEQEINLVQVRLDGTALPGPASGASGVYYLWLPGRE